MNINNMKGIFGEAVSNEVKTLELRVGQIVRGVVLQQLPNNEATVSINGVQVRAKMDIPVMEGQASLLQVQPDSKGGFVHLKQVDPTSLGFQDPMKDILKALKMPDKDWAHELIKELRREGFALNKETAAAFQRAALLQPAGVSQEQWMNAAAAVFKRGLPMTELTISAMHQLQSGNPLHVLIGQLRGQMLQMLQQNSHPELRQLLAAITSQLEQGAELLRSLTGQTSTGNSGQLVQGALLGSQQALTAQQGLAANANGQHAMTSPQQAASGAQPGANMMQGGATQDLTAAAASSQSASVQQGQAPTVAQAQLLPQLLKWLGVNHEALFAKQLLTQSSSTSTQSTNTQQQSAQPAAAGLASINQQMQNTPAVNQAAAHANPSAQQPALSQFSTAQQQLNVKQALQMNQHQSAEPNVQTTTPAAMQANQSVQHIQQPANQAAMNANIAQAPQIAAATVAEQATASQANSTQLQSLPQMNAAGSLQQQIMQQSHLIMTNLTDGLTATAAANQANNQVQLDSLKASIMQLIQANDLPSSVREGAQQLLHAITGQQLMLSIERNHSVFSHITLYVPLQDDENGQTAAVHVQTRRNRKGELDSDNCRLVFDLQMKNLGPTLVDVNIVNKIVSLSLWNDHPAISYIVDRLKPEMAESLQSFGYTLSMVRTSSIPKESKENTKQEEGQMVILPPDIEQMNSTRYRGVDLKI